MGKTSRTMIYHNVYKTKVILFSHTYKLFHRLLFHIKIRAPIYTIISQRQMPGFYVYYDFILL